MGIEPTSRAWEARVITTIRRPQNFFYFISNENRKVEVNEPDLHIDLQLSEALSQQLYNLCNQAIDVDQDLPP